MMLKGVNGRLLHTPAVIHLRNIVINIMASILARVELVRRLRRARRRLHDRIFVRSRLSIRARARDLSRRSSADGRVGDPAKLDLSNGRDVPRPAHEFFGLVALLEGHDDSVWLFRVRFDGLVLADALKRQLSVIIYAGKLKKEKREWGGGICSQ